MLWFVINDKFAILIVEGPINVRFFFIDLVVAVCSNNAYLYNHGFELLEIL